MPPCVINFSTRWHCLAALRLGRSFSRERAVSLVGRLGGPRASLDSLELHQTLPRYIRTKLGYNEELFLF